MPDMQKLHANKERILNIIRLQGPSFPARIARETGISPLFVSAFLAELASEKRLKISNLKVGSSPLYFLQGQESDLEKFIDNLNPKQREAFHMLKSAEVLKDETLDPAMRVAIRSLKDFASPLTVRIGDQTKTFWRHVHTSDEDVKEKIRSLLDQKPAQTATTPRQAQPPTQSSTSPLDSQALQQTSTHQQPSTSQSAETSPSPSQSQNTQPTTKEQVVVSAQPKRAPINKPKKPQPSEFANAIREFLDAKNIEVLETISEKKKEFVSKIRLDETFGKQSYYLIAKDKKKVSTNDLTIALQQAQTEKMPALFISPGDLDKKADEHLKSWHNLIKFEKVNL